MFPPTPDLSRPLPVNFFYKVPSEILGLIASADNADLQTSLALCRLDKRVNLACSYSLYGHDIVLRTLEGFDSFCNTLSGEKWGHLVKAIRSLSIWGGSKLRGQNTGRRRHKIPDDGRLILRVLPILRACTNIDTLRITYPTTHERESWESFQVIFNECKPTSKSLGQGPSFARLRHLELRFTLNVAVLHFLRAHCSQLYTLSLHHINYDTTVEPNIIDGIDMFSGTLDVLDTQHWDGKPHVKPLSLSSLLTTLDCSPFLTPFLVPSSFVDSVRLKWPGADEYDNDYILENVAQALKRSQAPRGVRTLSYTSDSWNPTLMEEVAQELPDLELLCIENVQKDTIHGWGRNLTFGDGDRFTDSISAAAKEYLPSFNNLKVLILNAPYYPGGTYQTFYQEFKLVEDWADICPSLLYVVLPHSGSSWIRDPKYSFFVPDTLIQRYKPKPKSNSSFSETGDPFCPPEYTAKFVHKLAKLEGVLFQYQYLDHFDELKRPTCTVKSTVEVLLEKAGLLEELRSGDGPDKRRLSKEDDDNLEKQYDRKKMAS